MVDQNHLDWLREGAEAWNSRRASNDFEPDLSGADLSVTDLRFFNLKKADLEKANLSNSILFATELSGSNLARADLREVVAIGTRFDDTVLFGANLQQAKLSGADFSNSILQRADLTEADLSWANLTDADIRFAVVAGARLDKAILARTNTLGSNLWQAVLYEESSAPAHLQPQDEPKTVSSVSDLLAVLHTLDTEVPLYFRGEQRCEWRPIPSLFREGLAEVEDEMLTDLASRRPEEMGGARTALEQLLLAQHYKLSTRLLDVTSNPLVALFFACEEVVEHDAHDGRLHIFAVPKPLIKTFDSNTISIVSNFAKLPIRDKQWLLSREGLHPQRPFSAYYNYDAIMARLYQKIRGEKPQFDERIDMKDLYGVFVVEPQQKDDRIRAQSSAVLVSAFQERFDHQEGTEWNGGVRPYGHYTLSIPSSSKESILKDLRLMGVSRESLFPGLESAATEVMRRYKLPPGQGKARSDQAGTG